MRERVAFPPKGDKSPHVRQELWASERSSETLRSRLRRGRVLVSVRLARQRARRAEELDAVLERECCDRCDLV